MDPIAGPGDVRRIDKIRHTHRLPRGSRVRPAPRRALVDGDELRYTRDMNRGTIDVTRFRVMGLGAVRRAAGLIRRGADKVEEATTALLPKFDIRPIEDIPVPRLDLTRAANPVPDILNAPEFAETCKFFADNPAADRSLVSAPAQALIHALIRNLRPMHVVEIGTFRGGTTEAMSRAVHANGQGTVHTVGPFDGPLFSPVFECWPKELRRVVHFYEAASMPFFMEMERLRFRPDLVFVDGNHDYEFASFDIQCAARRLSPGGFIVVDNISQAGPFFAALDFLRSHPEWIDCGCTSQARDQTKAFDRHRTNIPGTDFMILRAPPFHVVGERPQSFGDTWWRKSEVHGLTLSFDGRQGRGTLHVQCILRGFGDTLAETFAESSCEIPAEASQMSVSFAPPAAFDKRFAHYSVEPWLIWSGERSLRLRSLPAPF
jgi:predicted O-methyltransferase YrrM